MQLPFGFGKSKSIVGLDIGSSSVKAVELAVKPKGIDLLHMGVAKLPPEAIVQGAFLNSAAITEAIREAVSSAGIRSKMVATAVSGGTLAVAATSRTTAATRPASGTLSLAAARSWWSRSRRCRVSSPIRCTSPRSFSAASGSSPSRRHASRIPLALAV